MSTNDDTPGKGLFRDPNGWEGVMLKARIGVALGEITRYHLFARAFPGCPPGQTFDLRLQSPHATWWADTRRDILRSEPDEVPIPGSLASGRRCHPDHITAGAMLADLGCAWLLASGRTPDPKRHRIAFKARTPHRDSSRHARLEIDARLQSVLDTIGVPESSERRDIDWIFSPFLR